MRKFLSLTLLTVSLLSGDVFTQGKTSLGFYLGAGEALENSYMLAGFNAEYCVVDNVAVGGLYRIWFGGDPTLNEISVYSNYYFPLDRIYRPYIGGFLRQTLTNSDTIRDFASYGLRGGLIMLTAQNSYIAFGYVAEYYDKCLSTNECQKAYPEITVGLSF